MTTYLAVKNDISILFSNNKQMEVYIHFGKDIKKLDIKFETFSYVAIATIDDLTFTKLVYSFTNGATAIAVVFPKKDGNYLGIKLPQETIKEWLEVMRYNKVFG
jgi:hypothetical protein